MRIYTIPVTPFAQNARVIVDESTKVGVVVDPGGDVARILEVIDESGAQIAEVWLTHAHLDHAGGVKRLLQALEQKQRLRPRVVGHRAEAAMRGYLSKQAMMFGLSPSEFEDCPEPDRFIEEGDVVKVGTLEAEVRFTPGHSPGHVVFYFSSENLLIAGDTLFQGSIGRTDLPGGNHEQLLMSIRDRIYNLPGETAVLCGHGPDTTVGDERRTNPFVRGADAYE